MVDVTSVFRSEQQRFLLEVVTGVAEGKGVNFFQQNRVKQLMWDEGHRNFVLSKLNKAFEHKVGPEDNIEDVRITKDVFKGTVKMLQYIVAGLEHDYQKCGTGGIASAMQVRSAMRAAPRQDRARVGAASFVPA